MSTDRNRVPLAVEDYLAWLKARQLKDSTIRSQRTSLQCLTDETGDIRCSSVTAAHIDRVLWAGNKRGWGERTTNIRIEHIGAFLQWCKARRIMPATNDPLLSWRPVRVPQRKHLRIPPSEWAGLLDAAPWPVDRAMIAVGLHLCLRISEITSLKVGDLHLADYTLDITRHKTGQVDTMPVSLDLEIELRRYLTWYTNKIAEQCIRTGPKHKHTVACAPRAMRDNLTLFPPRQHGSVEQDGGLFVGSTGRLDPTRQMTNPQAAIRHALRNAGYEVDADDRAGWHTLRRSGARATHDALSEMGLDQATRITQAMLGHESATTTEKYLGIEVDRYARDKLLKGRSLFRGVEEGNVIPLRKAE